MALTRDSNPRWTQNSHAPQQHFSVSVKGRHGLSHHCAHRRKESGFRDYPVRGKASSPPCLKLAGSRCPSGRRQGYPGHSPAGQSCYEEQNGTNVQLVPEVTEVQGCHLLQPTPIRVIEELLRRPQLGRPTSPSPSH